jgi:MFS family permease
MNAPRVHPAWVVIVAGVSVALHIGKLPPALPVLREALDISLLQAGFLLSLVQLAGMALGLAIGLSTDALGLRRSMLLGMGILCGASALGGFAQDAHSLLVLRAIEGVGFLLGSMPAPSLLRQLVAPQDLSRMMGWWGAYMPLGTALALLCAPWVIGALGWSAWWWALSALSLLAMAWLAQAVPSDAVLRQSQAGSNAVVERWTTRLRLTLHSGGPWWIALSFAMYSCQWLAVIGFLPTVYAQLGMSSTLNGLLTATVAAANMLGNVVSGRFLSQGVPPRRLLVIGFGVMGLGTVLAFGEWQGWALPAALRFVSVVLFSAVGGMIPGTLFSMAVRLAPTPSTVSTTVGWMQQWSAAGQFLGPPAVAWVAVQAGGWQWTWLVTVACCVVGLGLSGLIARALRQPQEVPNG